MPRSTFFRAALFALPLMWLTACGDGTASGLSPVGEWRFTGYSENGVSDKFKDCDARTVWHFSDEAAPPLGDGTKVKKMKATAPDDCMHFGFEASWTMMPEGKLFISTTRIGGVGGSSKAGRFEVVELTDNRMVLALFGSEYVLER
jgi:hypothetical protein